MENYELTYFCVIFYLIKYIIVKIIDIDYVIKIITLATIDTNFF